MSRKIQEVGNAALRLLSVDGLGRHTLLALIRRTGGIENAGHAILSGNLSVAESDNLPKGAVSILKDRMEKIEIDALRWAADAVDASLVTVMDDDFPHLLNPLPACPAMLWFKGDLRCLQHPAVSIVGSRRCTEYGVEQASIFSTEIVSSGISVISGGARGIDAAAHRSALKQEGKTVAIMGCGLSIVYPPEHGGLFDEIVQTGGLIMSEFPCNRPPRPEYFPRRNRIVSGLSTTTLVVEAALRSGALITARIAVEEHGRHCFALPGRISDVASAGCLHSIRDGWLEIALHPDRVIEETKESWVRLNANREIGVSNFGEHQ